MPTLKFKGKAAQAVFDALTAPRKEVRRMEWGDLYAGTGVCAFEAHRKAALSWLMTALDGEVKS